MTPTVIWEALNYVDNLRFHGQSLWDAACHAWHRFGIPAIILTEYVAAERLLIGA